MDGLDTRACGHCRHRLCSLKTMWSTSFPLSAKCPCAWCIKKRSEFGDETIPPRHVTGGMPYHDNLTCPPRRPTFGNRCNARWGKHHRRNHQSRSALCSMQCSIECLSQASPRFRAQNKCQSDLGWMPFRIDVRCERQHCSFGREGGGRGHPSESVL